MEQTIDNARTEVSSAVHSHLTVMVVDDDEHTREALRRSLETRHDRVLCCAAGDEALARLRAGDRPDLILLDLIMPGMNGWQFRVEQKNDPDLAPIPVIAMSGDHSPQAAAIDASAYLRKPIVEQTLMEAVERTAKDIQRRRSLARATELERIVSLGALLGGIAHEVNNPLAFILGNIDLLQRQLLSLACPQHTVEPFSVAAALRSLERLKTGAERIAAVMRCASMFASADLSAIETIDVHEVLESSIQVASNEIRHGAHLVRAYGDVPHVRGNAAKLGQVFLNLILNAVHAIRDDGGADHVIRIGTQRDAGHTVITVSDTATVLDPACLARLFAPAVPNDPAVARLHFVLAVSREVIEEMGGRLEVDDSAPHGVTFRVVLPGSTRTSFPAPQPKPPVRVEPDRPTVLIVDDEPLVCDLFAAMLSDSYEVAAFTSARAALASCLERDYGVILCDVMMPELNGMDLFDRVTAERPELRERFVFITGGAFTEHARLFLRQTSRPVVRKPCTRQELRDVVSQILTCSA
jgi:CheY-like chemotaxis protein/two-component sensor histidine kinase